MTCERIDNELGKSMITMRARKGRGRSNFQGRHKHLREHLDIRGLKREREREETGRTKQKRRGHKRKKKFKAYEGPQKHTLITTPSEDGSEGELRAGQHLLTHIRIRRRSMTQHSQLLNHSCRMAHGALESG
jgi:hypothetical protein